MRIVIDMQGAQTASRVRGIGRVTRSLAEAIIRRGGHDVHLALNALLPEAIDSLREQFGPLLPKGKIHVWQAVPPLAAVEGLTTFQRTQASLIYAEFMGSLNPDVVLVPSMMTEGYWDNAYCDVIKLKGGCLLASVVYDFIPLRLKKECLPTPEHKAWYAERLQQLSHSDVLLAISFFTKNECSTYLPDIPAHVLMLGADALFCPGEVSGQQRSKLYATHGIDREFLLYSGGLDTRKNVKRLMEAYSLLPQPLRRRYQLVFPCGGQAPFLGEYAHYRDALGLSQEDVRILGYVSDIELRDLYRLCALFVFPSLDEGFGLPVLEAVKCGAPVICSNATAVPEILDCPEALFDPEDVGSICQKMELALTDAALRRMLIQRGNERADLYSWERCAETAVAAFEELVGGGLPSVAWPDGGQAERLARICKHLALPQTTENEIVRLADALAHTFPPARAPQLLVDISILAHTDSRTGIQRVVRGIAVELVRQPPVGRVVRFIRQADGRGYYVHAHEASLRHFCYDDGLENDVPVAFGTDDVFLGLDLSLYATLDCRDWLKSMHWAGVRMYFVVYDIIPLLFPAHVSEGIVAYFEDWLKAVSLFDGLVCISATVAGEVRQWLTTQGLGRSNLEVTSFRLGAEIDRHNSTTGLPSDAGETLARLRTRPTFLMVSTIEPRKGHRQTLAAMEQLWAEGVDANLVLVGKYGWKMDGFEAILAEHPEKGRRLFWLRDISDEYLAMVYKAATAVLSASEAEGFGLSIVEGASYGKPLILRDIPVFREVVGDNAFYFSGLEAKDLADALRNWLEAYASNAVPSSAGINWATWRESCDSLLAALQLE